MPPSKKEEEVVVAGEATPSESVHMTKVIEMLSRAPVDLQEKEKPTKSPEEAEAEPSSTDIQNKLTAMLGLKKEKEKVVVVKTEVDTGKVGLGFFL